MIKYEIGIHFKSNTSKAKKEQIETDIMNLSMSFQIIKVVNEDILQAIVDVNEEEIVELAKILKDTKQIRYFYMELVKD